MSLLKLPMLGKKRCSLAPTLKVFTDVATFDYSKLSNAVEIGRAQPVYCREVTNA